MSFKKIVRGFVRYLPEVKKPIKRLSLKQKLYYTLLILVIFFVLGAVPLAGLDQNLLGELEFLSMIMGASIGTILTLGIGPLVTASIVLQLLSGSGFIDIDQTTDEGKKTFQAYQKFLSVLFILLESYIFVFFGGLTATSPSLQWLLVIQLIIGGFIIMILDDFSTKWGVGSGISLFIAAGVSRQLMVQLISPFAADGSLFFVSNMAPVGAIPSLIAFLMPTFRSPEIITELTRIGFGLVSTIVVFLMSVYAQTMKVEINLAPKSSRGFRYPWPLNFLYTSNIPVILAAALLANLQLLSGMFGGGAFENFVNNWLMNHNFIFDLISQGPSVYIFARAFVYLMVMVVFATLFSYLWVQTSGMDAESQAKNILGMGLKVPGYRANKKLLVRLLNRYIPYLAILGGIAIGLLAATADLMGALVQGTGLLLTVMILYKFYENLTREYAEEMSPELRQFVES